MAARAHSMRASELIGKEVKGAQGEELGEINDLVVDTSNEQVRYAILSQGGVLGIGDKLFAFPISMFDASKGSDQLALNVTKEKLENAPSFESSRWPDMSSNEYTGQVDKYFSIEDEDRAGGRDAPSLVRASELIGKNIDDQAGETAGEVDDLIVDVSTGRVQYAVVDFDDSWSRDADGKLVAIPLNALSVPRDESDKLVIDMPRDRIDMSRAFEQNQWPDFNDPAWRDSDRSRRDRAS